MSVTSPGSNVVQAVSFQWSNGQAIAANQADVALAVAGNTESRTNGGGPTPLAVGDALAALVDGIYLSIVNFSFTLADPIGAAPIVVKSVLYDGVQTGPDAWKVPRVYDYTTLRAGAAGDRFAHSMSYEDRLAAGWTRWVEITTGSTPINIDAAAAGNLQGHEMGYLGAWVPT